jgi:hypothetical protein
VRIVDRDGSTTDFIDVRQPVGIELRFTVLGAGLPVLPKIKVVAGGQIAFNAMDVDSRWEEPSAPGDYVATAWIPGNYLTFHVQDPAEGDSSRGTFTGQWRGVVRPLLDWTVEQR